MATGDHAISCQPSSPGKDRVIGTTSPAGGFLAISDGDGGKDLISRLPNEVLSNVVARLSVEDGVRTSALSHLIWSSTPVDINDLDIFPDLPFDFSVPSLDIDTCIYPDFDWPAITDRVTCLLASHRGSFRNVNLSHTCYLAAAHDSTLLRRWLCILADKGVHTLVLSNFPSEMSYFSINANKIVAPATYKLPANVRISSLRRLNLVNWDFPSTDDICRGEKVFRFLRELVLEMTNIGSVDIDRIIQYSPDLEKFVLTVRDNPLPRVLIRSRSLICMIFGQFVIHELQVLAVPKLQRLIFMIQCPDHYIGGRFHTKISIVRAPSLQVLGYLDPSVHVLELGDTIIEADTKPN
ncbi:hypothetical protein QOZ80_2AG0142780 [Eleusine coracana subsp. coracana]|nr:hypothetical protein QOZ80_2AG0142780 [Eleusine coracana subsp. coracana]